MLSKCRSAIQGEMRGGGFDSGGALQLELEDIEMRLESIEEYLEDLEEVDDAMED